MEELDWEDSHLEGWLLSGATQHIYIVFFVLRISKISTINLKLRQKILTEKMQRVEKNQIEIKHAKVVRIRKMADLEKENGLATINVPPNYGRPSV